MEKNDKHPMLLINIISKSFRNTMRRKQESIGIPDGYRMILMMLKGASGSTQQDIAKLSHLSKPTVSLTLKNMESNGLIERKVNEKDKRITNIFLTENGYEMIDKIMLLVKDTEKEFFEGFSEEDIKLLKGLLERILANAGCKC